MATTVEQLLNEAHATEQALITTLQAHLAMTPPGAYRQLLDRHLTETRRHARAVEGAPGRARRRRRRGGRRDWAGADARRPGAGALQGPARPAPRREPRGEAAQERARRVRDRGGRDRDLRRARGVAEASGDRETARLAARHRADEERMLADLRRLLPELARAARSGAGAAGQRDPVARRAARRLRPAERRPGGRPAERPRPGRSCAPWPPTSARTATAARCSSGSPRSRAPSRSTATTSSPKPRRSPACASPTTATVARIRDYESRHRRRVAVLEAAHSELSRPG